MSREDSQIDFAKENLSAIGNVTLVIDTKLLLFTNRWSVYVLFQFKYVN